MGFWKKDDEVVAEAVMTEKKQVEYVGSDDLRRFLEARNRIAVARDENFRKRFSALLEYQLQIEKALDGVRGNPVTRRALADMDAGVSYEEVCRDVARRREDTFSNDARELSTLLAEVEREMGSWQSLARLCMEAACLAPMPELGRPESVRKNAGIFLALVRGFEELRLFGASSGRGSLYERVCQLEAALTGIYEKAMIALEKICGNREQMLGLDVFKALEEEKDVEEPDNPVPADG